MNAAARLIFELTPGDHVTSTFLQLHWLPVGILWRILYKLCCIMHSVQCVHIGERCPALSDEHWTTTVHGHFTFWISPVASFQQNLGGRPLPSHLLPSPSPFFPSNSPSPLEVGPLNTVRGVGEHCRLPQLGGLGGAPAEIEFGAFWP